MIDVFFYGLFMDVNILRKNQVSPANPRRAYVEGFGIRIGGRATLVPDIQSRAYGMLIGMTHAELDLLYSAPGLEEYRAEAVLAQVMDGAAAVPALCYNLPIEPSREQRNPDYAIRLQGILSELGFPAGYIESLAH
jgi:hypothetical protein